MDPVVSGKGRNAPTFNPTLTYADALASGKQFDIIWVPAVPFPERIPKEEIAFIAQQAPQAKYVMSVCGGAVQLAFAGILTGRRATTNKAFYREIVTSSGCPRRAGSSTGTCGPAGSDMALAFVEHLEGAKVARFIRGTMEIPEVTKKDDPFAAFHGLV
ncbi:class I glutamine amidotransferase-like protein [Mycena latifolia]|nr:class I glutamine amidotransferase-like protein [Mycena latifolia]